VPVNQSLHFRVVILDSVADTPKAKLE